MAQPLLPLSHQMDLIPIGDVLDQVTICLLREIELGASAFGLALMEVVGFWPSARVLEGHVGHFCIREE